MALIFSDVSLVKAYGKNNPITGQHAEIIVQPKTKGNFNKEAFKKHLAEHLQNHMVPRKIKVQDGKIGHRHKRS